MEREFKPGIYSHFKTGKHYFAVGLVSREEDLCVQVRYSPVVNIDREWTRDLNRFMSVAPEDETNKTGQEYRFEFVTNAHVLYQGKTAIMQDDLMKFSKYLSLGMTVSATKTDGEMVIGQIDTIGLRSLKLNSYDNHININWHNINKVIRYME